MSHICRKLKGNHFYSQNLSVTVTFLLSEHVNHSNVQIWASNNQHAIIDSARNSAKFDLSKQIMFGLFFLASTHCDWCNSTRHIWEIPYDDPVLGKKNPNDQLLQQDGVGNICIFTLQFRTSWIENCNENKLADTALTLGHLILLTLHHFTFNSDAT